MQKKKIIYLIGLDRSGSTITGALLGMHQDIAHFGELQFHSKAVLENRLLREEGSINESAFWSPIHTVLKEKLGEDVFQQQNKLKNKYERWRNLPLLLFHFITKNQQLAAYWKYNQLLIDALLQQEKKTWICDSSKNVIRRFALGLCGAYQIETILITRDARAYAWSKQKRAQLDNKPFNIKKTSLKWTLNNLLFRTVAYFGAFLHIRFEDFGKNPDLVFERVQGKIKLDLTKTEKALTHKEPIHLGNIIAGSWSVRKHSSSIFHIDDSWKEKLTSQNKKDILSRTKCLMRILGYLK